jgi:hypothetical protein
MTHSDHRRGEEEEGREREGQSSLTLHVLIEGEGEVEEVLLAVDREAE